MEKAKKMTLDQFLNEIAQDLPLKRLNRAEELAALVAFLVSDSASGITGCAIPADGGQLKCVM